MGISITKLLIVLAIIIIIFGTKRLRNIGSDLGGAIKSFRSAIKEGEEEKTAVDDDKTIEGEVPAKKNENA
ncbi:Sec-independent protein translocase protein TatA [Candidatus Methylobacter favarea]|uniref:Sec-independent protein translocase protein TatA n=1 Tax=Candidatus Methylobacter favarea TaxID=2707345 RepID=A0A8S0WJN6_9GAMM|nr:twin-arginine translocase TatA/TatE family subunit [Candidatus Methylobacter favarea]CAA9891446.1 Sec-independent protein translocase protein TatA [Candidatus Methylobacter favarea]